MTKGITSIVECFGLLFTSTLGMTHGSSLRWPKLEVLKSLSGEIKLVLLRAGYVSWSQACPMLSWALRLKLRATAWRKVDVPKSCYCSIWASISRCLLYWTKKLGTASCTPLWTLRYCLMRGRGSSTWLIPLRLRYGIRAKKCILADFDGNRTIETGLNPSFTPRRVCGEPRTCKNKYGSQIMPQAYLFPNTMFDLSYKSYCP